MLTAIKEFVSELIADDENNPTQSQPLDKDKCAAVLMVHVMAIDGAIKPEEEAKLLTILETHYDMNAKEAQQLADEARQTHEESIDLYAFTSILKAKMSETERMGLVEDLWEMVYADGEIHEFEDNIVWRMAELLNISSQRRIQLKSIVRDRAKGNAAS